MQLTYIYCLFIILLFSATEKGEGMPENTPSTSSGSLSNMAGVKAKDLPSFWVPAMTPDAKPIIVPKPSTEIYCPVSGKILKIKDLIDVKFTLAPKDDDERGKALISRQVRYMCPITRGILFYFCSIFLRWTALIKYHFVFCGQMFLVIPSPALF